VVDSLKALDPEWPIREADVRADVPVGRVRANRDRTHCSRLYSKFDRLVGAAEHCRRLMCATSIALIHAPSLDSNRNVVTRMLFGLRRRRDVVYVISKREAVSE
jgi:hypothetical protein